MSKLSLRLVAIFCLASAMQVVGWSHGLKPLEKAGWVGLCALGIFLAAGFSFSILRWVRRKVNYRLRRPTREASKRERTLDNRLTMLNLDLSQHALSLLDAKQAAREEYERLDALCTSFDEALKKAAQVQDGRVY